MIIPTLVIIMRRLSQSFLNSCTDSPRGFSCFAVLDKTEWFSKWRFHYNLRIGIKAELAYLILNSLFLSLPHLGLSNSPELCPLPSQLIYIGCFGMCNITPFSNTAQVCVMFPIHKLCLHTQIRESLVLKIYYFKEG